ncbi:MAG: GNAT family N-acetyltransferase [Candidatus Helarchaeota archaeon]
MEIRVLEQIDYTAAARVLYESYIPQWSAAGSPQWTSQYIEYLDKAYVKPNGGICVGAYEGNQLVGVGFGFLHKWTIPTKEAIPVMCICNLGVIPNYQRRGFASAIIKKLEETATEKNIKLSYRICNVELNDYKVLEKLNYQKKIGNVYQYARIMGKEMIETTAKLKRMGRGMKLLLKAVAGFPKEKDKIQKGVLREGREADINSCVQILNNYRDVCEITRLWTNEEFSQLLSHRQILRAPFEVFFYVWDIDGEINGFITGRFELIQYSTGTGVSAIAIQNGFKPDLTRKEKTSFVVSTLYAFKEKNPETFATNLALGHHEEKAFEKAGFNNDRSKRPLYVKPLETTLKDWLELEWNCKKYIIPYQR